MEILGTLFGTSSGSAATAKSSSQNQLWDNDGFGFGDLFDAINPLQHIPILSTFYRGITGDSIGGFANVVGGTIFGGPIGGGIALANEAVEYATGVDLEENIVSAFTGDNSHNDNNPAAKAHQNATNSYENSDRLVKKATTHEWIYGGTFMA